jgi:uncharacterized protein
VSAELRRLRALAIGHSLFAPVRLDAALDRIGFVQADPIRAPARAQDLILRHRVAGYRIGDLERRFTRLEVEEDYLYAYGFLARRVWRLVHPRVAKRLSPLERRVLEAVRELGVVHPRALAERFGRRRMVNAWGGQSHATTRALDHLQYRGHLRVARRERGIRLYEVVSAARDPAPPRERMRGLVLAVAGVLAPVAGRTLAAIASRNRSSMPGAPDHRAVIRELIAGGELEPHRVDGAVYLWPAAVAARPDGEVPRRVRFLAPFDPVVWDRRRFEHLFGWAYRFEAYTPVAQRVRGYYAMPMLWGDRMVGWANASAAQGGLEVDVGYVARRPRERDFGRELDAEIARLEEQLAGRGGAAR